MSDDINDKKPDPENDDFKPTLETLLLEAIEQRQKFTSPIEALKHIALMTSRRPPPGGEMLFLYAIHCMCMDVLKARGLD